MSARDIFASATEAATRKIALRRMPLPFRYRAFISYCHQDRKAAAQLQAALENFRPPPRAVTSGRAPAHLRPIFRDREILGSTHDLTSAIREALDQSETLIVVCSPRAASSRWVAAEIRHFVDRRGPESIFCLVIDGEPNSADPARECLPEPLRSSSSGREVLAADARPSADGWRDAVLKIIAGMTGWDFAELARREQQRLRRRALIGASVGILLATIFGALAVQSARSAAAARKSARSAELMVEYLGGILSQLSPRDEVNTAQAALIPLIDASTRADRLQMLEQDPTALIRVRHILARAYLQLNNADRALPILEKNVALATQVLGPDHPHTVDSLSTLGNTFNALGNHQRGSEIHQLLLDHALRTDGEQSEQALKAMTNLSVSKYHAGQHEASADLITRVYEVGRLFLPTSHIAFQTARRNYASLLLEKGKLDESLTITEQLYRDQLQAPGPDHLETAETQEHMGELYERLNQPERAAESLTKAAKSFARIHGEHDSRALQCAYRAVHFLASLGQSSASAKLSAQYFGHPPDPHKLGLIDKNISDLPP